MRAEATRPGFGMQEAQYLLLVATEASWLYPWSLILEFWLGEKREPLVSLPVLLILLAAAMMATRLARRFPRVSGELWDLLCTLFDRAASRRERGRALAATVTRTAVVVLGFAAACLVGLGQLPAFWVEAQRPEIWSQLFDSDRGTRALQAAGVAGVLWWRGLRLGSSRPTVAVAEEEFTLGVTALAALLVVSALTEKGAPLPGGVLVFSVLAFVSTVLVGMPLARVVDVGRKPRHQGGPGVSPSGCWLAMLLGVVGALLLSTLLLAQLLDIERILALWETVRGPAGDFLGTALEIVARVVSLPFQLLGMVLAFLGSFLPPGKTPPPKPRTKTDDLDWLDKLDPAEVPPLTPEMLLAIKVIVVVALAGLLVWAVVRALAHLGDRWRLDGVEEVRESLWTWPSPADLWRRLLAQWRPLRSRIAALAGARRPGALVPGQGVREVYRQFLALGAALGWARHPAETPLEYERRLRAEASLPDPEAVRALTEGYHQVRYAPPTSAEPDPPGLTSLLIRLRALWRGGPPAEKPPA